MLTIICCLVGTILNDSTPSYEQRTADYFFEIIWKQEYKNYDSIEFENKTDTNIHAGHINGCREWVEVDRKKFELGKTNEQIQLNSKPRNISITKTSKSKRLKLFIGTRIQVGNTFIVQVDVYKPFEFVNHYFIKLNKDGKIIDTCESKEII